MDDDSQDELINKNAALGKGKRHYLVLLSETGKGALSACAAFCFNVQNLLIYPRKADKGVFVTICLLSPDNFFVLLHFVTCVLACSPGVSPGGQL